MRIGKALAAMAAALGCMSSVHVHAQDVTPVVQTDKGKVQGLEESGIDAFLGIPYAAPPVGERRFRAPEPADAWTGVADATGYGAPCMQLYTPSGPRTTDLTRQIQAIFPTFTET